MNKVSIQMLRTIRITTVIFVSFFCVSCGTESEWNSAIQSMARYGGHLLLGATDEMVQKSDKISDKDKETFNSIVTPYTSGYVSDAGRKAVNEDYLGAATSLAANAAIDMGLDPTYVDRGYVAANKAINGDYAGAGLDVAQIAMNASGDNSSDLVFDKYRGINEAQLEYQKNLADGMPKAEAEGIRNRRLAVLYVETKEKLAELHRQARRRELLQQESELEELGWSEDDTEMLYGLGVQSVYTDVNGVQHKALTKDDYGYYGIAETSGVKLYDNEESVSSDNEQVSQPEVKSPVQETVNVAAKDEAKTLMVEKDEAVITINSTKVNDYACGDVKLTDEQIAKLDQIAEKLNKYQDIRLVISGHTCTIGSEKANEIVGMKRAQVAKNYLVSKGIAGDRIETVSKGYSNPIVDNDTEEHRRQNRRIEFLVL